MRVKIVQPCQGSLDGIRMTQFAAGEVVELPGHLARSFLSVGWAESVELAALAAEIASAALPKPAEKKVIEPVVLKRGRGRPRKGS